MMELPPSPEEFTRGQAEAVAKLTPEQRHAVMDWLHARRAAIISLRDGLQEVASRVGEVQEMLQPGLDLQPNEQAREGYLDMLTGIAMLSESVRAAARGDDEVANELVEGAREYGDRVSRYRILPLDPPED